MVAIPPFDNPNLIHYAGVSSEPDQEQYVSFVSVAAGFCSPRYRLIRCPAIKVGYNAPNDCVSEFDGPREARGLRYQCSAGQTGGIRAANIKVITKTLEERIWLKKRIDASLCM